AAGFGLCGGKDLDQLLRLLFDKLVSLSKAWQKNHWLRPELLPTSSPACRTSCEETSAMQIKKAAVLGAGVMGAQIAAHLANAGIPCLLLDIAPTALTPEEAAKGLTLESRVVRSRIAQAGLDAAIKAKPAAFFSPELAGLITVGNFEDDLPKL